jgi:hypothetical protein
MQEEHEWCRRFESEIGCRAPPSTYKRGTYHRAVVTTTVPNTIRRPRSFTRRPTEILPSATPFITTVSNATVLPHESCFGYLPQLFSSFLMPWRRPSLHESAARIASSTCAAQTIDGPWWPPWATSMPRWRPSMVHSGLRELRPCLDEDHRWSTVASVSRGPKKMSPDRWLSTFTGPDSVLLQWEEPWTACEEKSVLHVGRQRFHPQRNLDLQTLSNFFRKIKHVYYNYVRFVTFVHEAILVKFWLNIAWRSSFQLKFNNDLRVIIFCIDTFHTILYV